MGDRLSFKREPNFLTFTYKTNRHQTNNYEEFQNLHIESGFEPELSTTKTYT